VKSPLGDAAAPPKSIVPMDVIVCTMVPDTSEIGQVPVENAFVEVMVLFEKKLKNCWLMKVVEPPMHCWPAAHVLVFEVGSTIQPPQRVSQERLCVKERRRRKRRR